MNADAVDLLRLLGIISAGMAVGALVALMVAKPGHTAFRTPWRYWGATAGLLVEISGVVGRLELWGEPLSFRDVNFLAINVCILVTCIGALLNPPHKRGEP